MLKRAIGFGALVVALPALSLAQQPAPAAAGPGGVAIDHKAVGCIVAGKFPKMNACFVPNSDVARARVYFRAEGGTSWYYVEMKSDAPCMSGILPKPRKELIDKHINYYVHVTDKSFTEARTEEYDPLVVSNEGQCKDKLVAAALPRAAVQVFPALPAGFAAGGIGTAAAVGGGVAVAGAAGGVYAATKGNNNTTTTFSPTTTSPTSGGTTTTTTLAPVTTTTTSTLSPPVFRFSLNVAPTTGTAPLDVTVDMCGSTPTNSLRYFYDFDGDGVFDFQGPFCSQTRTYNVNGVNVFPSGFASSTTTLPHHTWTVTGCAEPRDPDVVPQERKCASADVRVDGPTPTTTTFFGDAANLNWSSQLDVAGASAQVILNGTSAVYSAAGRSNGVAPGRLGQNRLEAQLVQAAGKPGTWRFDFSQTPGMVAGSVRVIAGDVAVVAGDAVVFRMRGTAGERVVFTFETKQP